MRVRTAMAIAFVCMATATQATSLRTWSPEDVIENPRYSSANGRYTVVVREYPFVGDFAAVRAGTVLDFDSEDGPLFPADPDPATKIAALYDGRRLVSTLTIDEQMAFPLVADSGDRIVVIGAYIWPRERYEPQPLLTIYDAAGAQIRRFMPDDIFTARDVGVLRRGQQDLKVALQRELVTITTESQRAIRIRTADGAVLDPPRDLLRGPRVYATSVRDHVWLTHHTAPLDCEAAHEAIRIASKQLVARATWQPLPAFPEIADKARIRGRVGVEVVVSETGAVICARATKMPFGLTEAALAAAREWTFAPYEMNGRPVKVTSELVFHFAEVAPEQWEELAGKPAW